MSLDFSATWFSNCDAQDRAINALRAENPAYNANISFIKVDWCNFGKCMLSNALLIPRRASLWLEPLKTKSRNRWIRC